MERGTLVHLSPGPREAGRLALSPGHTFLFCSAGRREVVQLFLCARRWDLNSGPRAAPPALSRGAFFETGSENRFPGLALNRDRPEWLGLGA